MNVFGTPFHLEPDGGVNALVARTSHPIVLVVSLLPTELLELSIRVLTRPFFFSPLLTLNAVLVRLQLKF